MVCYNLVLNSWDHIFLMGFIYKSVSAHMDKVNWIMKCSLSVTLVYEWMSSLVFQGSCYACPPCTLYIHSLMLKVFRIEHCPWIWDLKFWCTNYSWCVGCDCELLSRSCKLFSTFPTLCDLDSPIWVLEWRQCHVVTQDWYTDVMLSSMDKSDGSI